MKENLKIFEKINFICCFCKKIIIPFIYGAYSSSKFEVIKIHCNICNEGYNHYTVYYKTSCNDPITIINNIKLRNILIKISNSLTEKYIDIYDEIQVHNIFKKIPNLISIKKIEKISNYIEKVNLLK